MTDDTPRIRVLHVDDDPAFADLTAEFLERQDDRIDVVSVTSASDALAELDDDVDCVVSDYDMPGRNGVELLDQIRADRPDLPFILFTGKGSEEVASDAISRGVTDYLQKGGGRDQYAVLANRIANGVEATRSRRAAARNRRRLETLISNLPGVVYRCANEPGWPMEFVVGECESLTGYTAGELEAGDVVWGEDVIHQADRQDTWGTVQQAIADRAPFELTYRIVTKDGRVKRVWERGRGVAADDDRTVLEGFVTALADSAET